jgi:outer membrane lipase/esterase
MAVAAEAGAVTTAPGTAYDNVIVFGDSLSDVGNAYIASGNTIPGAPYYEGRFSNGLLWVEHIAGAYGVTLTPSFTQGTGGNDWAVAGAATTVDASETVASTTVTIPSLVHQKKSYLKSVGHKADPKALYVIWGGGNDVAYSLAGKNGAPEPQNLPTAYAAATVNIIASLKLAGAKHFLVANVPDIGLTPDATGAGAIAAAAANQLSKSMNAALAVALADPALDAGADIYSFNTFKIMDEIVEGTTHFVFTDVVDPCVSGTTACPNTGDSSDPDHTLFWDGFHPTSFAHAYVAIEALKSLPLH